MGRRNRRKILTGRGDRNRDAKEEGDLQVAKSQTRSQLKKKKKANIGIGVDSGGVLRLVGAGQNRTCCWSKNHNDKPVQS